MMDKPNKLVKRTKNDDCQTMSLKEAAALIGCSPSSLSSRRIGTFALIKLNHLPNSPIRVLKSEVEAFIEERIEIAIAERDHVFSFTRK